MASAERPQSRVEILQPITVTAIDRKLKGKKPVATRVHLTYSFAYDAGPAHPSLLKAWGLQGQHRIINKEEGPAVLATDPALLAFTNDTILERFIALGVRSGVAAALVELSADPSKNDPVVLETGTLAELLRYGITPPDAWTFLLNHGVARPKSMAVLTSSGIKVNAPDPNDRIIQPRTYDPWAGAAEKLKLLDNAILCCSQAAEALTQLQAVDMAAALVALGQVQSLKLEDPCDPDSELKMNAILAAEGGGIGPQPALAPLATERLIAELEQIANNLKNYRTVFKQPRNRPTDPYAADFCRDWYAKAMKQAGDPLYAEGAALYSLAISKATEKSFRELCRRALPQK